MKILGHRGCILKSGAPYQNSLEAFHVALQHVDGFETDACLSADGEVFLMHEGRFDGKKIQYDVAAHLGTPSQKILGKKRLDECSSQDIARLQLKDGSPIPRLSNALDLLETYGPDKTINIELKSKGVEKPVVNILKKYVSSGMLNASQVVISSFNHAAVFEAARLLPDVKYGLLYVEHPKETVPLYPWFEENPRYKMFDTAALQKYHFSAMKPAYIIVPHTAATPALCEKIQIVDPHVRLMTWIYATPELPEKIFMEHHLQALEKTGVLSAVVVDNPKEYSHG